MTDAAGDVAPGARVLSWNVRDLLGDPLAVHRVIRAAAADVACLQEAPRRPGARLRLALLERATGLRLVAGGRGAGGTALLVGPRVAVGWAAAFRLPVRGRWTRTRGACVADCLVAGGPRLSVACVHLPLDGAARLDHAARVVAVLRRRPYPAVVAGDLNEPPGSPAWRAFAPVAADPSGQPAADPSPGPAAGARAAAEATFPARSPVHRLDAVLWGAGLAGRAVAGWYDPADAVRATDHLPVLRSLRVAG